jgi:predicted MFS family arabinose efflux permease
VTTAGTLAAAEWVEPDRRSHVLSWALIGQPAAWIVGMPLIGFVGDHNWRYSWLTLPLVTALLAAVAVGGRGDPPSAGAVQARLRPVFDDATLTRWLAAELLANSAWAGMLVYAGGLLVESYGASTAVASIVLALGAGAYVAGNLAFRRATEREPRLTLAVLSLVLAAACVLFGAFRPSLVVSGALFSVAGFAAGGRTLVSSAFGLRSRAELRTASMSIRTATMQLGYFAGSFAADARVRLPAFSVVGVVFAAAARRSWIRRRASAPRFWAHPDRDEPAPTTVTRLGDRPSTVKGAPDVSLLLLRTTTPLLLHVNAGGGRALGCRAGVGVAPEAASSASCFGGSASWQPPRAPTAYPSV